MIGDVNRAAPGPERRRHRAGILKAEAQAEQGARGIVCLLEQPTEHLDHLRREYAPLHKIEDAVRVKHAHAIPVVDHIGRLRRDHHRLRVDHVRLGRQTPRLERHLSNRLRRLGLRTHRLRLERRRVGRRPVQVLAAEPLRLAPFHHEPERLHLLQREHVLHVLIGCELVTDYEVDRIPVVQIEFRVLLEDVAEGPLKRPLLAPARLSAQLEASDDLGVCDVPAFRVGLEQVWEVVLDEMPLERGVDRDDALLDQVEPIIEHLRQRALLDRETGNRRAVPHGLHEVDHGCGLLVIPDAEAAPHPERSGGPLPLAQRERQLGLVVGVDAERLGLRRPTLERALPQTPEPRRHLAGRRVHRAREPCVSIVGPRLDPSVAGDVGRRHDVRVGAPCAIVGPRDAVDDALKRARLEVVLGAVGAESLERPTRGPVDVHAPAQRLTAGDLGDHGLAGLVEQVDPLGLRRLDAR